VTIVRERLEYAAFLLVASVFSALPLRVAAGFSAWSWGLIAPHLPRHARALDNLEQAFPEKTRAECEKIAREMWRHLGRTFAEFFHLSRILAEQRVELVPFEAFERVANNAPFVVCSPHLGNWEIASQAGLRLGLPVAGTYQALSNPLVDRWLFDKRKPLYAGGLFPKSAATARTMLKLPRSGVSTAFIADLREWAGVPVSFFGRTAMSNPFPALIARTVGLPMYATCVVRKPGERFEMHIVEVPVQHSNDRDADVLATTQNLQFAFEGFVRAWPEQWMWAHKRWG
jgi:KDO2-lipid IV(A) lauroyltransferase